MILVDTGPLVALFDPKDERHRQCRATLREIREPLATTVAVLTEAFHILDPVSIGSQRLRDFVEGGGPPEWHRSGWPPPGSRGPTLGSRFNSCLR